MKKHPSAHSSDKDLVGSELDRLKKEIIQLLIYTEQIEDYKVNDIPCNLRSWKRADETTVVIERKNPRLKVSQWEEDYHNGDIEDYEEAFYEFTLPIAQHIHNKLLQQGLIQMGDQIIEELALERMNGMLKSKINQQG